MNETREQRPFNTGVSTVGTSHSKCRYITIAVFLTLFASATALNAQTQVAQPNCQGRCVYGVEGNCNPQGPFGFTHTQWRKWPEPPPTVPRRQRDMMGNETSGPAELDLPQPADESDANPEFSHLKDNESTLSSDLGTSGATGAYDSYSTPVAEPPNEDESVPPMPEISGSMGGDTSTPSVDLPPVDAEAPGIFGPANDAGETPAAPSLDDFDLDLNSRNTIPSQGGYVNRLRHVQTETAPTALAPANPLRFSSFAQTVDQAPAPEVIPAGFVHPNVVKATALPSFVPVHETKPVVANPLR